MRVNILKLNRRETAGMFWILTFCMVFLLSSYFYLINLTIWNVAERAKLDKNSSALESKVGEMEAAYMSKKSTIDLNLATSLGFNAVKNTQYINRTTLGRADSGKVE